MEKVENPEDVSFVRVEGASTLILSIQHLAKLYTNYANLVLSIKKLHDTKVSKRKSLFQKVQKIEDEYNVLLTKLPKDAEPKHVKSPDYNKIEELESISVYPSPEEKFDNLKNDFEKIREELKKIR